MDANEHRNAQDVHLPASPWGTWIGFMELVMVSCWDAAAVNRQVWWRFHFVASTPAPRIRGSDVSRSGSCAPAVCRAARDSATQVSHGCQSSCRGSCEKQTPASPE